MDNIKNYPVTLTKQGKFHGCKLKIYTDDAPGLLHVTKTMKNYQLTRSVKDGPPEISFGLSTFEVGRYTLIVTLYREN